MAHAEKRSRLVEALCGLRRQLWRWLAATETAIALMITLAVVLALATVFEGVWGPSAGRQYIYHSWWFVLLISLLGINVFASLLARFPWRRHQAGFVMTHVGLLVLIIGAAQSLVGGIEGRVSLTEGDMSDRIWLTQPTNRIQQVWLRLSGKGRATFTDDVPLPMKSASQDVQPGFSIELLTFQRTKNPGGFGDASFASTIRLVDNRSQVEQVAEIMMNRPATYKDFSFSQIDVQQLSESEIVVTLGVVRDPGRGLKYLGVTTVCIGTMLTFLTRRRRSHASAANDVELANPSVDSLAATGQP